MTTRPHTAIGLTMRVTRAEGYDELRDSLAQDWAPFLAETLPGIRWTMLPNIGAAAVAFAQAQGVNALLLTGGNDIGEYAHKDATDRALLAHALQADWPVLGVCRGLQIMQHHLGGTLAALDPAVHVARRHPVTFAAPALGMPQRAEVNSYHRFGIRALAEGMKPLASADDGSIEGAMLEGYRALGVMWHPEREPAPAPHDRTLMQHVFAH